VVAAIFSMAESRALLPLGVLAATVVETGVWVERALFWGALTAVAALRVESKVVKAGGGGGGMVVLAAPAETSAALVVAAIPLAKVVAAAGAVVAPTTVEITLLLTTVVLAVVAAAAADSVVLPEVVETATPSFELSCADAALVLALTEDDGASSVSRPRSMSEGS
jgi:hypothetical protein